MIKSIARSIGRIHRRGVFISPPFHSTANPPVGLAYLVPYLYANEIQAEVRDLNIEARELLRNASIPGTDPQAQEGIARELFPQARRSYLGEALTWAWHDDGGRQAVFDRVSRHPNLLLRSFWQRVGIHRLVSDECLIACDELLRQWFESQVRALASGGVDWVGLSLTVSSQAAGFYAASIAKGINPDLIVVAGGPHVTHRNARELLNSCGDVDAAVPAPAFAPLTELLSAAETIKAPVAGAWTRQNSNITCGGSIPFGSMDSLPFADWSIVEMGMYEPSFDVSAAWGRPVVDRRTIPLQTSRGCKYNKCEFCHNVVDYPSYLARSPELVIDEISTQVDSLKASSFFFTDDEFNGYRRRVLTIGRLLEVSQLDIRFFAWLRLDKIDTVVLEQLYLAGCREIFIGVESIDDDLLLLLAKGYSAGIALDKLRCLAGFQDTHPDFRYSFNLIFGHPRESLESAKNTLVAICAEPELFVGHVAALCRYHIYEGTPAFARYGQGAAGCLDCVVPEGITVDSFRYLTDEPSEESLELWGLVAEVTSIGRRSTIPDLSKASIYD